MFYLLGKKTQKNFIGDGHPRPQASFPPFGGGGQETRPGDEVGLSIFTSRNFWSGASKWLI